VPALAIVGDQRRLVIKADLILPDLVCDIADINSIVGVKAKTTGAAKQRRLVAAQPILTSRKWSASPEIRSMIAAAPASAASIVNADAPPNE
jgi:hypothetical protein